MIKCTLPNIYFNFENIVTYYSKQIEEIIISATELSDYYNLIAIIMKN